ncbi:MAG: heavy metal translocating P-type ATPase [Lachnospiraceae bacterium]|nr:heavy metal translocating P-type ATPase [Lachnospiraceae bacterium]
MKQYNVTGMSCAACSARVEKVVSAVEGVSEVSVSLLTNSMMVEGGNESEIIKAVEGAGYGASPKGAGRAGSANGSDGANASGASYDEDALIDRETPKMKKRLIASLILLIPLMYVSMGEMMWGWPVPAFMQGNHIAMGIYELLLSGMIMVINQKFFINGFKGLINRAPNMDTLVAMGSAASFGYSVYAIFAMSVAMRDGDMAGVMAYMDEFYFESAAMILTLITVGKMLEARSKGKTTDALKSLMKLAPKKAVVIRDNKEVEVDINEVAKGDIFVVKPGESIPVDGRILEGHSAVNEAALTGESIPVDKEPGKLVSAATINQSGYLKCEATRVGEDTTLSKIIQMVSDAAATKAPIAKIADRVSGVFVPAVITIAVITTIIWLILGQPIGFALARGISVLVISCPCALGLATPVAIMVGNGRGAKSGVLFKTAVSLEETGKVDVVALDKTGTITKGEPHVTDIHVANAADTDLLLETAIALEQKSEHPLAKAITKYGKEQGIFVDAAADFEALPGNGLTGKIDGDEAFAGNARFMKRKLSMPSDMEKAAESFAEEGKTPLYFARNGQLLGIIAVADVIKEDSPEAVRQLKNMGIRVVMLTGDHEKTANAIGNQVGVDEVIAGVLPDGKEAVIRKLTEKYGKTAMVGDGINDAPALTRADIGIAIGAGTDVAIDAADVVLMKSNLLDVPAAIRMSRQVLKNIKENLFWAFFYNVIGIPLAAGLYYPLFGWKLNPMFGAAAMSLSSFCVVSNALRLNFVDMYNTKKDKKRNNLQLSDLEKTVAEEIKEEMKMEKTVNINGMMCPHCEATVKKALEAIDGIEAAVVSHEANNAIITCSKEVDEAVIKAAILDKDFEYVSIQ